MPNFISLNPLWRHLPLPVHCSGKIDTSRSCHLAEKPPGTSTDRKREGFSNTPRKMGRQIRLHTKSQPPKNTLDAGFSLRIWNTLILSLWRNSRCVAHFIKDCFTHQTFSYVGTIPLSIYTVEAEQLCRKSSQIQLGYYQAFVVLPSLPRISPHPCPWTQGWHTSPGLGIQTWPELQCRCTCLQPGLWHQLFLLLTGSHGCTLDLVHHLPCWGLSMDHVTSSGLCPPCSDPTGQSLSLSPLVMQPHFCSSLADSQGQGKSE